MEKLTQERLKELLHYDPESGKFTRLKTAGRYVSGTIAGSIDDEGYLRISIDGKHYRSARLACLYINGEMPIEADHINRIRHDDRWVNIRQADRRQNAANRKIQSNNTSGVKGISWDKRRNQWGVNATIGGKLRWFGYFEDMELAELVASEVRSKIYGEFAS
ncbi:MAG: hypothetical protein [Bacteriophage sp.]|nr:MAG: hypothetical protein [Bacteriophage sp.]